MKNRSLNEVQVLLGGIPIKEQAMKITITPNAKRFTVKVANDGVATMSENKDNSHTVKYQCMESSASNAILSAAYTLAMNSPAGTAGIIPLVINDKQGNSIFVALSAVITGWPERAYEPESGDIEWELFVEDPQRFEGGN
jgi:hypothetical protein